MARKHLWFVILAVLFLSPAHPQHFVSAQHLPPCPSGMGPNGITAGEYLPQQVTPEESQWLWRAFGHRGAVSADYAGEACMSSDSVSSSESSSGRQPSRDSVQTVCASGAVGPEGLRPGYYVARQLTQRERNWLCRVFGDCRAKELAPADYGGQHCAGDPSRPLRPSEGRVSGSSASSGSHSSGPSGPASSGQPSSGSSNGGRVSSSEQLGVDFEAYCQASGFVGVERVGPYPRDWYCQNKRGKYYRINVQDVCVWQHGEAFEYVGLEDGHDPFGWSCSSQPQPAIASGPQTEVEVAALSADSVAGACEMPEALTVGDRARVTLWPPLPNRVRVKPGMSAPQTGSIDPGEEFDVIGGPRCVSGYRWWKVQTQGGLVGWTAEGDASDYWLEPVRIRHYE